ncbi:YkgJ family cysteine cluster protein [Thioalkalivibrio sp. HK1]|uniref:YkgJ family cysteine cluster protein n=1 Tax=Thioalkalivibrio sp. HK1 TaxID=1469245 RepID=UPI000470F3AE|nr:YkgJ family cysteine cluster protein [Thioalkalivibrio sp. HK1]
MPLDPPSSARPVPDRQPPPHSSPVEPAELQLESEFRFNCHPGIACFNACCRNIDITLTPYDILRLKRRLDMDSKEFVTRYTIPFEMDFHGMPGLKMRTRPGTTECTFLTDAGCSVYEDRPVACRYYALGNMGVRRKDESSVDDIYFVVREDHCLGHEEAKTRSVAEYRTEQGIEPYDDHNRAWRDIVLKKRSSGPTVGAPSARSLQLFDMCSYDLDSFRDFIRARSFRDIFDIDADEIDALADDEERLLAFSMRFLQQILFGEMSIPVKDGARKRRIAQRKETWAARREDEIAKQREELQRRQYEE